MSDETALQRLVEEDDVPKMLRDLEKLIESDEVEEPYEIAFTFTDEEAPLLQDELEGMFDGRDT